MVECTTYPFKNKQWFIKNSANQQSQFKRFRRKHWVTNMTICGDEYTWTIHGKSFPGGCWKSKHFISFQGNTTRITWNNVYYGKVGSIENITLEEFIPGKFSNHINNEGRQCVLLLGNECHYQIDALVHYTYEKSQRKLVELDIQGVDYTLCDSEIASKENKSGFEERYFCFANFSKKSNFEFHRNTCMQLFL